MAPDMVKNKCLCYMKDPMKTKNFYVVLMLIFISAVAVWLTISPEPNLNTIVRATHKKISNLKNLQPSLKRPKDIEVNQEYLQILGFTKKPLPYNISVTTIKPLDSQLPVIASSVWSNDLHNVIHLLKTTQKYFPTKLVVLFDLDLDREDLLHLQGHCNSSTLCQVKHFDLSRFPSHVQNKYLKSYRPLCIQTALRDYGSVIWLDPSIYITSSNLSASLSLAREVGLAGWPVPLPTSALTHPKMFDYFRTLPANYYFHHAVEANHLIVYNTPKIHKEVMLPWVKCALIEDCINPTGAQDTGCKYDRRPRFLYWGCHHYDMSALNVILGLMFEFTATPYSTDEKVFETAMKGAMTFGQNFSFIGGDRYKFTD